MVRHRHSKRRRRRGGSSLNGGDFANSVYGSTQHSVGGGDNTIYMSNPNSIASSMTPKVGGGFFSNLLGLGSRRRRRTHRKHPLHRRRKHRSSRRRRRR